MHASSVPDRTAFELQAGDGFGILASTVMRPRPAHRFCLDASAFWRQPPAARATARPTDPPVSPGVRMLRWIRSFIL